MLELLSLLKMHLRDELHHGSIAQVDMHVRRRRQLEAVELVERHRSSLCARPQIRMQLTSMRGEARGDVFGYGGADSRRRAAALSGWSGTNLEFWG